jgi:tRNA uridine 5-carboxymethylaminomethyl modification enzyme
MKKRIENRENLFLKQGEIVDIDIKDGSVIGISDALNTYYEVKAVIIATGTFLNGKIFVGEYSRSGGPDGLFQASVLSDCLRNNGIKLARFKTGTPARIHRDSIDFSKMEVQRGDDEISPFSFDADGELKNKVNCYLTYSTEKTKKIILENIHRSPLYGGLIEGTGPRYCPSFEDKITRFPDKERHQAFIEPMGLDTKEMYIQGMSSSLPYDVQLQMYRSVIGLENAEIMRPAYAIEYDCADPSELTPGLQFKKIKGLYGAGQFNGTSGYEEAAAQGLVAGINAARYVKKQDEIRLTRDNSYIGVLIDDLTAKGTKEPYRIMTSRSEYRLLLRQDNADARLTPLGYEIGLIPRERYDKFLAKYAAVETETGLLRSKILPPSRQASEIFEKYGSADIKTGIRLAELLKRPEISYEILRELCPDLKELSREIKDAVSIAVKYEGYIKRQRAQVNQFKKLENKPLPPGIDYEKIYGLRIEARQKLKAVMPESVGQASRLSGVSPADIAVLLIYLETCRYTD